jgi:SAM-dependent methyltransferase
MRTCSATENHAYLLERFVQRLFEERPASVLDVGCGAGALLRSCAARGVVATGVEASAVRVEPLLADGLSVETASASELPFDDDQFEWVTLRHVPHHLADPQAALHEAARVAARGLLIAEPWFDTALPSQRVALDYDRWLKVEHRRGGMLHGDCIDSEGLLSALPEHARADVELEHLLRLRARTVEDLLAEAAPHREALAPGSPELAAFEELVRRAHLEGLSWNGSLLLVARLG